LKSIQGWGRMRKALTLMVLIGFLSLDYAVCDNGGVLAETRDRFPPVYEYLANSGAGRPVLELPTDGIRDSWQPYKYLHYQTGHWRPLLGGMSGWEPPCRVDLSEWTGSCPSTACFDFLRYTPAATLVVHLDEYSDTQRAAWETADLGQFGFNFAGRFGSAWVWERGTENEQFSNKLAVSNEDGVLDFDDIEGKIGIALRPAEDGRAWRYFDRVSADVEVIVTTHKEEKIRIQRSIRLPPYLLPGEKYHCILRLKRMPLSELKSIRLVGSLINECTIDLTHLPRAS